MVLDGVVLGNTDWASHGSMLKAEQVRVRFDLWDSIFGTFVLPEVVLERPVVNLEKSADGQANWAFGGNLAADAALETVPEEREDMPQIGRLKIIDGELTYLDPTRDIDLQSRIATVTGEAEDERVELDGEGRFEERPFQLTFSGGSLLRLRQSDEPYPVELDATIGETEIGVDGTLTDPFDLVGLDLHLAVSGPGHGRNLPYLRHPLTAYAALFVGWPIVARR